MHIFLWVLQILLAIHTTIGAVWKFSHSAEQTMPSLKIIPQSVWLTLAVIELLCSVALVLPIVKSLGYLAPYAATVIAVEMLFFCALHLYSKDPNYGPMMYWLIVAVVCAFVAYGRFVLKPFNF